LRALAEGRDRLGPQDAAGLGPAVLLLSGSNDPITPPEYAARAAATLAHATQLVGRDQGHGQIAVGCVPRLFRTFSSIRSSRSDAACLALEPPTPFFLSLLGPGP
jgi:hypothetical protein